jgi:hypothetical protein
MSTKSNRKVEEKVDELMQVVEEESVKPQGIQEPRIVKLGHPTQKDAVIFYTTDGTYPVPNKAKQYRKPFPIYEDTVIKAVALVGEDVSPVFTREYKVL